MKKSLLLLVAGAMAISAGAQYARHSSMLLNPSAYAKKTVVRPTDQSGTTGRHSSGRTTSISGACVFTETFPSTVLTSGGSGGVSDIWTTGVNPGTTLGAIVSGGAPWKWTNAAPATMGDIGAIASTTASNGWIIFDADSIHAVSATAAGYLPGGWIQSPAINCSALTTVGLSFQQLFEEGVRDTCLVEVCTTPGFTTGVSYYPVYPNDNEFTESGTANPDTTVIDITAAAAGHGTVYIRFVFQDIGETSGSTSYVWDFAWAIDDICVGALAAHDVALDHSYLDQPFGGSTSGAFSSAMFGSDFGMIPQEFVTADSIYPVSQVTNYSHAAEPSVPVTCSLSFTGGSGAAPYSQTYTYTSLSGDAYDSGFVFPGYWSNSIGKYTFSFNAALTTDADPANNTNSATFQIDDTIWNVNNGPVDLGNAYFLYGGSGSSAISNCAGARFDVGPGVTGDTVSGFGVGFASSAGFGLTLSPTGKVCVQLYSNTQGSSGWSYVGESYSHTLSASNISSTSALAWTDFRTTDGYGPYDNWLILQPNTTYAAIVQISGMTDDLLIYSTPVPDASYFEGPGYFGQSGTSLNTGGPDFGVGTDQTGTLYVPCVQMYFGNIKPQTEGVRNVSNENFIHEPFPNPSDYSFTIPMTLAQDNKVTVTLMDMMGRVVSSQNINAIGGQTATAVFYTGNLADGIYIYSVQANGVNTTGRVVVAH